MSLQGSLATAISTQVIGVGDFVEVVIWEAAAGGLFSAPVNAVQRARILGATELTRATG